MLRDPGGASGKSYERVQRPHKVRIPFGVARVARALTTVLNYSARTTRIARLESDLLLPPFTPAAPENICDAFDHDDFFFELKMNRFRALAHVAATSIHVFIEFAAALHVDLAARREAALEILD